MAHHGTSSRIVVDIEPELKKRLYASLSLSGSTLKDWFRKAAAEYCDKKAQPSFSPRARYGTKRAAVSSIVREERGQTPSSPLTTNGNGESPARHTVVSMFSGCGGMDLGFRGGFEVFGRRYRSLPFEIVWANDLNGEACKTYRSQSQFLRLLKIGKQLNLHRQRMPSIWLLFKPPQTLSRL